ncbi:unnamed protein product [Rhodiola kirilowii]
MADTHQWHDPLLITDASLHEEENLTNRYRNLTLSWHRDVMEDDIDFTTQANDGSVRVLQADDSLNVGLSMFGFSLSAHDLVTCARSPDTYGSFNEGSLEIMKCACIEEMEPRMDISFEKNIYDSEMISASPDLIMCDSSPNIPQKSNGSSIEFLKSIYDEDFRPNMEISFEKCCDDGSKSFELLPQQRNQDNVPRARVPILHINSGLTVGNMISFGGVNYVNDNFFEGGDTSKADTVFGDGDCWSLYQTARYGNFSYKFPLLEPGTYIIDFHFAEFEYRSMGMRVFNILIQDRKVVLSIDIFDRVGANKPFVVSDLETHVDADGNLSIRFEGVVGSPILCGISLWKDTCRSASAAKSSELVETASPLEKFGNLNVNGNFQQLCKECEVKRNELQEKNRLIEELKRDNQLKSRECLESCRSLQELQNELMRKSMHVGSLAFAVEGQVKEKSKWSSSLIDFTRKLKIMKMEQIELSEVATDFKKCLSDFIDMSSIIQSTIRREADLHCDLKVKLIEGTKERKELNNKVLELKGNIRVFCRSRPLNPEEISSGASMAVDFESAKNGDVLVKSSGAAKKMFKFDAVFSPKADQAEVFQDTAPFVRSVLDGYNVCIFAYGQTGTGKTFTMEGTQEARGVNYRTLDELFCLMKNREHQYQHEVSVSVLEVYNEQIRDLLTSGTQPGTSTKRLEIRQVGDGVHVPGLVEAPIKNMSEAWEVLKAGSNARAVGSTNANECSSRSHCIHCVMVKSQNLLDGECTRSKLWLVDLAGSERIAKTEVQGERLKEAQNINRSLFALGDVISALATKSPHIPFRNSKLTHLLQDSLGGDSKTLMFVQISPNEDDLTETLCSLNFASRVRGIELGPAKKQVDTAEFLKNKLMVEKMKQELKSKDLQVKKMEDLMHNLDIRGKETDMKNKLLLEKVKELEMQLIIERNLAQQSTDSKKAAVQQIKQQQEQAAATRPPLASLPLRLYKNITELQHQTFCMELENVPRLLTQYASYEPLDPIAPQTGSVNHIDLIEKENNPETGKLNVLSQRAERASSICATARGASVLSNPRRNSLIPLPFLPMQNSKTNNLSNGLLQEDCFSQPISEESPKGLRSGGKKTSNILRRSLQKKIQIKPAVQQQMRKGGVNVGEKIRLSIHGRGRMARRVLLGNNGKRTDSTTQHKIIQEKEKGWNIGTGGRNLL